MVTSDYVVPAKFPIGTLNRYSELNGKPSFKIAGMERREGRIWEGGSGIEWLSNTRGSVPDRPDGNWDGMHGKWK